MGVYLICGADSIEDLKFPMIRGPDGWEYSQDRHDYRVVGDSAIDGGRAYTRVSSAGTPELCTMVVKDGKFELVEET